MKRTVMILADGARFDVLKENISYLPNLQKLVGSGSFKKGTSVFPSTTGPAHLPMLTGQTPGGANIPGIRWFDRNELFPEIGLGVLRLRSYVGVKSRKINKEMGIKTKNLFELAEKPRSVFEVFQKGLGASETDVSIIDRLRVPLAHFSGNYHPVDELAISKSERFLKENPDFLFLMLPGIDGHSHHESPFSDSTLASYRVLDDAVGRLSAIADQLPGETLFIICSDHGHSEVAGHIDLDDFLTDRGFRVACHSRRLFKFRPNAVVAVSGNGMAHIYLKNNKWKNPIFKKDINQNWPSLESDLLSLKEIDLLIFKEPGGARVTSKKGTARIKKESGLIHYSVLSRDPFGFRPLPSSMTKEEALQLTADTDYPDGIFQVVQLIDSKRAGDIIVSAAPGYDLRDRHERVEHKSGHGGLHESHMAVPIISSEPLSGDVIRTEDIFPTVCQWMGFKDQGLGRGRLL